MSPPVVIHTPIITTYTVLTITGVAKIITVTDGVETPYITWQGMWADNTSQVWSDSTIYTVQGQPFDAVNIVSTSYPITYTDTSTRFNTLACYKVESYSDGSVIKATVSQLITFIGIKQNIYGAERQQYTIQDVTEIDQYGQEQTVFPYIIKDNSGATWAYMSGQTETQTWSDGRVYTYTYP